MSIFTTWQRMAIARAMVLILAFPIAEASAATAPPNPGAVSAQQSSGDTQSAPSSQAPSPQTPTAPAQQQPVAAQQQTEAKPAGTAAAPVEKASGVTASRPAGAVIAPAKQRRARSILIRISLIVGAAVAVGTVVALSKASPARPN